MKVFVALWSRDTENKLDVDQETRVAGLRAAINAAQEKYEEVSGGSTDFTWDIKSIFVAPEYLFTRQRTVEADDRAIGIAQVGPILTDLSTMSRGKPGMLIVPGTIIYKVTPEQSGTGVEGAKDTLRALDTRLSTVPRIDRNPKLKGLAPVDDDTSPTIQTKLGRLEKGGEIDHFVRNVMVVYLNGSVVATYSKMADKGEARGDVPGVYIPGRKCGLVDPLHGRSFGFEICYDHEIGVLKALAGTTVDFHVIASAFVTNNTQQMIAKPGGFVLHASSEAKHSTVYYKPTPAWKQAPANERNKNAAWLKAEEAGETVVKVYEPVTVAESPLSCFVLTMT